jgi:hypothetical protein
MANFFCLVVFLFLCAAGLITVKKERSEASGGKGGSLSAWYEMTGARIAVALCAAETL